MSSVLFPFHRHLFHRGNNDRAQQCAELVADDIFRALEAIVAIVALGERKKEAVLQLCQTRVTRMSEECHKGVTGNVTAKHKWFRCLRPRGFASYDVSFTVSAVISHIL